MEPIPVDSVQEAIVRRFRLFHFDYNNIIPILVGPHEVPFSIHPEFLIENSNFFKVACSETWSRGDGTIRLPEVPTDIFRLYLGWIYTRDVEFADFTRKNEQTDGYEAFWFIELYLLADLFDDVKLRNRTMEILVTKTKDLPNAWILHRIYSHTTPNSIMREMMVDRAVMLVDREAFTEHIAEFPAEFVQEVAVQLMNHYARTSVEEFRGRLPFYMEPVPETRRA